MSQNNKFSVLAPAKLNLRLKIVGRRQDGYHLLSMLNACISLYDKLVFEVLHAEREIDLQVELGSDLDPDINFELSDTTDNLVYKAARLFFEHFSINDHALKIKLSKNIPVGAGLGGGSSDASATLLALSKYFFPELNNVERIQQIAGLALKLGSDLPFFLHASLDPAIYHVSGIGEVLKKLTANPLSRKQLLLISPKVHLSTIAVYKAFACSNLILEQAESLEFENQGLERLFTYQQILKGIDNDLSPEVFKLSKECKEIIEYLKSHPNIVSSVTGSGSSIFCLPKNDADSQALKEIQSNLECLKSSFLLKSQIVQFL